MGQAEIDRRLQLGDRRADQRVAEPQRARVVEQVGRRELGRGPARDLDVELRERGGERELAAVAEHGHRRRQRSGALTERRQPPRDAPPDALDPRGHDRVRVGLVELGQHLLDQQRVAARRAQAGLDERRPRLGAEPPRGEHADRATRQRRRRECLGVGRDRLQHDPILARQRAPRGDDHGHGQFPQAPPEIGQEPQAGLVHPLCIVHEQQQRPLRREVGHEPVQPVQHREPRVGGRQRRRGRCRQAERRGGERRGSLQPAGRGAFEQLADGAEAELPLQLAAGRGEHRQLARERGGVAQERGLADPRRALDDREPAAALRGAGDQRGQPRRL